MNPITPQQFEDHINLRRRDLADEFSANRARRAARAGVTRNRRRPPASILATAAFGVAAFLAGGLLDSDAVTARPPAANRPAAAEVTVATPECVAQPRPTERPVDLYPQPRRVPRNVPVAV